MYFNYLIYSFSTSPLTLPYTLTPTEDDAWFFQDPVVPTFFCASILAFYSFPLRNERVD